MYLRKELILTISLFIASLAATAQSAQISGKVIDSENNEPVSYATVSVLTKDSSLVTGALSDGLGSFQVSVEPGDYNIKVQFVSYETKTISIKVAAGERKDLGQIRLSVSDKQLEEVIVEGERTQMELKLDKRVFNVGKDLSNLGGSASDILDNLPSVTVDVEGNVELRGSTNVQVLIDGKPSGLVGLSNTDALRQLQGNLIETVEIITNPSARYDAEGMSGIINIILKKDKKRGVNGSFQVNTGWPHNHAASVNMNFRRDWVNLFVNYGIEYDQNPGGGNAFQEYRLQDTTFTTRQNRDHLRGGLSNNVRFGADFFLGEKSTLTTSFLYRYSNEENDTDLSFTDFNANGQLERYTLRNDIEIEGDENLEYAINYTRRFKREGHKLTADVQFQRNFETEDSDIVEISGPNRNEIISEQLQRVSNAEGEDRWMIQSDYIQPFGDGAKFETGFRFTLRNIDNEYLVEEQNDAGEFAELDTFTTDFSYNENVYAGYAILSKEYDRFSWQGGLRMESTDITGRLEEIDRDLAFNYTNFFPSAFLSYKLRNTNELQLSYSRRINRPRFRALNPFSSFTNNRNFRVGNPELQPEFTDSYEFGMLQNLESGTFYYGVYYRYTTDLIQRVQLEPDGIETVRTFENIGFARALGFELNVANDFTKWYRVSGNFNFFRNQVSGSYILADSTVDLGAEAITFTTRINNNFKFEGLFDGQLNINYQAPRNEAQGRRLSITSVDMGVTRDVFQKNGTLSLSVRDIFNSRKWRNITDIANYYEEGEWQWRRGPQFVVTLTYRLNQQKSRGRDRGEGRGDFDGGDGF